MTNPNEIEAYIKMKRGKHNRCVLKPFSRKQFGYVFLAGLLTRSALTPSHPYKADSGKELLKRVSELTAAGTVLDLHQIPF